MSLWVGIDPGLATFGYAVLRVRPGDSPACVGLGVFRTKKRDGEPSVVGNVRRCGELDDRLVQLFAGRDPNGKTTMGGGVSALFPSELVVRVCAEAMSFPRSSSAAAKIAMAWGLILSNQRRRNLELVQHSPQDVKRMVVGTNDASKKHVERVLLRVYGKHVKMYLRAIPASFHEHAYDALAVAHACLP